MSNLNKTQKDLIANNQKLVQKFVQKYFPRESYDDKQDLISEGYRILCERIDTFDPKKGKYSTWVYNVLGFCLRNVYNKKKFIDSHVNINMNNYISRKNQNSSDPMTQEDFADRITFNNKFNGDYANSDNTLDSYVDINILKENMKKLSDKERRVLEMVYSGYNINDIVKALNLDYPNQLYYIRNRALKKLKSLMN